MKKGQTREKKADFDKFRSNFDGILLNLMKKGQTFDTFWNALSAELRTPYTVCGGVCVCARARACVGCVCVCECVRVCGVWR